MESSSENRVVDRAFALDMWKILYALSATNFARAKPEAWRNDLYEMITKEAHVLMDDGNVPMEVALCALFCVKAARIERETKELFSKKLESIIDAPSCPGEFGGWFWARESYRKYGQGILSHRIRRFQSSIDVWCPGWLPQFYAAVDELADPDMPLTQLVYETDGLRERLRTMDPRPIEFIEDRVFPYELDFLEKYSTITKFRIEDPNSLFHILWTVLNPRFPRHGKIECVFDCMMDGNPPIVHFTSEFLKFVKDHPVACTELKGEDICLQYTVAKSTHPVELRVRRPFVGQPFKSEPWQFFLEPLDVGVALHAG